MSVNFSFLSLKQNIRKINIFLFCFLQADS